ncbi:MAG: hypothetical protein M3311_05315 [Thermoproteota archaeon]|nr:hypothetical protein [Thermoproteota archaeon]
MATISNSSPQESESYSREQGNLTVEKKKPSELSICMLEALRKNQSR